MSKEIVREQWLRDAVTLLAKEHIGPAGYKLPATIQVSVGFPHRSRGKGTEAIGQCWHAERSDTGHNEIFISPVLGDPSRVIDVLIHELAHVIAGIDAGHKKAFKDVAYKLELEGKPTATTATAGLVAKISGWLKQLPPFPHAALNPADLPGKKQSTRLLKCLCPACGYNVRVTQKWIDIGFPTCCCGEEMGLEGEVPDEE